MKKVAVVTGGGQGLGRATALALDAAGISVAVIGRTRSKLDETVSKFSWGGMAVAADLTDPDQVRSAFSSVVDGLGGVDILVNNAAAYGPFRFDEATDHQITDMIAQSLTAPLFCMREAIPLMRQRGAGDIVNISTQSVEVPQPFMTVYAAAKAGIETISAGLRFELKGEPIRIVVVQVGVIADTIIKPEWTPELFDRMRESWERTGVGPMFAYPGASPNSIAASVVHAVNAPRDIYVETVKVRGV